VHYIRVFCKFPGWSLLWTTTVVHDVIVMCTLFVCLCIVLCCTVLCYCTVAVCMFAPVGKNSSANYCEGKLKINQSIDTYMLKQLKHSSSCCACLILQNRKIGGKKLANCCDLPNSPKFFPLQSFILYNIWIWKYFCPRANLKVAINYFISIVCLWSLVCPYEQWMIVKLMTMINHQTHTWDCMYI